MGSALIVLEFDIISKILQLKLVSTLSKLKQN